jgi:hypothetical protein
MPLQKRPVIICGQDIKKFRKKSTGMHADFLTLLYFLAGEILGHDPENRDITLFS